MMSVMNRWGMAACGSLLAFVVGCSSSGGSTGAPAATTTAPPTTTAVTPSVDPSAAVVQAFVEWRDGGGAKILNALSTDMGSLADAGNAGDSTALHDAAVRLAADVDTAQAYKPMPSTAVQSEWSDALTGARDAANHFITGTTQMDTFEINEGNTALNESTSHLTVTTRLIDQLSGQS